MVGFPGRQNDYLLFYRAQRPKQQKMPSQVICWIWSVYLSDVFNEREDLARRCASVPFFSYGPLRGIGSINDQFGEFRSLQEFLIFLCHILIRQENLWPSVELIRICLKGMLGNCLTHESWKLNNGVWWFCILRRFFWGVSQDCLLPQSSMCKTHRKRLSHFEQSSQRTSWQAGHHSIGTYKITDLCATFVYRSLRQSSRGHVQIVVWKECVDRLRCDI